MQHSCQEAWKSVCHYSCNRDKSIIAVMTTTRNRFRFECAPCRPTVFGVSDSVSHSQPKPISIDHASPSVSPCLCLLVCLCLAPPPTFLSLSLYLSIRSVPLCRSTDKTHSHPVPAACLSSLPLQACLCKPAFPRLPFQACLFNNAFSTLPFQA